MAKDSIATTPGESFPPHISTPKTVSAGIPAIISTAKHGFKQMGTISSITNLFRLNKFNGFDCPGCAWPDPDDHRSIAEFCENGAKAVADEATKNRADPNFWSMHTISELSRKSDHWLNSQGRLTDPMILRPDSDHYEQIDWYDAFNVISDELVSLNDPNEAIFYTSGRTSNEAAFLWQLLARRFGTNNLPDCSNMCHESSGVALNDTIGIGKGTVKLEDFSESDLIIIVGQNPGTNHPRMLTSLRDAKKSGASIISINPLLETGMGRFKHPQNPLEILGRGTQIADEHIPVRVNGDQALFRGFAKVIIESTSMDLGFIGKYTHGFDEYLDTVNNTEWSQIETLSGIDKFTIERIGSVISRSKAMIICWAMGLTQHKNSVSTIQEISNICLLGGHIGRSGAGLCPVRGHSNVQGDRTVGIDHKPSKSFLEKLSNTTGIIPPSKHGVDTVEAVRRMIDGKSSVFLSMGGNFLSAMSDTNATADALRNCSLTVQVSTKANRSHLISGKTAIILPCLGRTEIDSTDSGKQFVTVENSMGVVHASVGKAKPASRNLRSEPAIITGIARSLESKLQNRPVSSSYNSWRHYFTVDWKGLASNYNHVRDLIENTVPGFDNYNERCKQNGGFYLPNAVRDNKVFNTATGKANFRAHELSSIHTESEHFVMMTIRSHDQYNTTIYGMHDRYRGINYGRRVVLVNQIDMNNNGWNKLDLVDITSHFKGNQILSKNWFVIPYEIPVGNVATYFPESNILIPLDSVADGSNTPTSKSVAVSIKISSA